MTVGSQSVGLDVVRDLFTEHWNRGTLELAAGLQSWVMKLCTMSCMVCYQIMFCYVWLCTLCCVVLCNVTFVMLWYVLSCYVTFGYVSLCCGMLCYVMSCYVMSCYAMPCYGMDACIYAIGSYPAAPIVFSVHSRLQTRQRRLLQNEPIVVYTSLSEREVGCFHPEIVLSNPWKNFSIGFLNHNPYKDAHRIV